MRAAARTRPRSTRRSPLTRRSQSTLRSQSPTAYTTQNGTWVAFVRGGGAMIASANCPMNQTTGNLIALRIGAAGPPTITTTWCQATGGNVSSPISTTTDGRANAIVWTLGTDNMRQLRGFDGETGAM